MIQQECLSGGDGHNRFGKVGSWAMHQGHREELGIAVRRPMHPKVGLGICGCKLSEAQMLPGTDQVGLGLRDHPVYDAHAKALAVGMYLLTGRVNELSRQASAGECDSTVGLGYAEEVDQTDAPSQVCVDDDEARRFVVDQSEELVDYSFATKVRQSSIVLEFGQHMGVFRKQSTMQGQQMRQLRSVTRAGDTGDLCDDNRGFGSTAAH